MKEVSISEKERAEIVEKTRDLLNILHKCGIIQPVDLKAELEKPDTKHRDAAKEVLKYYRSIHPKKARAVKPGHKLFKLIESRLGEGYSIKELKLAVDNNLKCDWHSGIPNGHGLAYVFRNQEKVDQFLEMKDKQKKGKQHGSHGGSEDFSGGSAEF